MVGRDEELFDVSFGHLVFGVGDGGGGGFVGIDFGGFIFPGGILVEDLQGVGEVGSGEMFGLGLGRTSVLFPQHNDYIISGLILFHLPQ